MSMGMAAIILLPGLAKGDWGRTYRVTITNLTQGQPLTPPVLLTHNSATGIFTLGEEASPEIQAIAENGNSMPLVTALAGNINVQQVVVGTAPILPANDPGGTGLASSTSFEIKAYGKARYLSFISMLICTNDGFTGLDTVRLPARKMTLLSAAYNARTEIDTEDFADMVPPCQGLIGVTSDDPGTGTTDPALAEEGIIIPHPGILGGVDLVQDVHGWTDPVAKIVIERVWDGDKH
jgi:hypothetical protein